MARDENKTTILEKTVAEKKVEIAEKENRKQEATAARNQVGLYQSELENALQRRKEANEKAQALEKRLFPLENSPLPTSWSFEEFQTVLNEIPLQPALELTSLQDQNRLLGEFSSPDHLFVFTRDTNGGPVIDMNDSTTFLVSSKT